MVNSRSSRLMRQCFTFPLALHLQYADHTSHLHIKQCYQVDGQKASAPSITPEPSPPVGKLMIHMISHSADKHWTTATSKTHHQHHQHHHRRCCHHHLSVMRHQSTSAIEMPCLYCIVLYCIVLSDWICGLNRCKAHGQPPAVVELTLP